MPKNSRSDVEIDDAGIVDGVRPKHNLYKSHDLYPPAFFRLRPVLILMRREIIDLPGGR